MEETGIGGKDGEQGLEMSSRREMEEWRFAVEASESIGQHGGSGTDKERVQCGAPTGTYQLRVPVSCDILALC